MAGIGFALQALSRRDTLSAGFAAFAISAIIAVGPWLFTVLSVAGINMATVSNAGLTTLAEIRIIIIYNFSISLVLSGPIAVVTTRFRRRPVRPRHVKGTGSPLHGPCDHPVGSGASGNRAVRLRYKPGQ